MTKKSRQNNVQPEEYQLKLENRLGAKTEGHAEYIRTMAENDISICVGPPGCGKTYTAVGYACEALAYHKINKIIFSRPIIGCGKGLAALPGNVEEKILPYFIPVMDCLEYFLGKNNFKILKDKKVIEFIPLELMRGMSIKDTFLLLDESSNAEKFQLEMLLSRLDKGSKFVLNGDYQQSDIKHCDFEDVVEKLERSRIPGLGFCRLTENDVQRPKLINSILRALRN